MIAHDDEASNGFVSEVEMTHRDKGTELFLENSASPRSTEGKELGERSDRSVELIH